MFLFALARVFRKYGSYDLFKELLIFRNQHLERMDSELDSRQLNYEDLIGQNVLLYLQTILMRSYQLLVGSLISVHRRNFISIALNTRAHFEVTGALGYVLNLLGKYYDASKDKEEVQLHLNKLILGRRFGDLKKPFESINVLNLIDEADKVFNRMAKDKVNMLRDAYEWLSEFCHPNSYGLIFKARKKVDRVISFSDVRKLSSDEFANIEYLRLSMPLFFNYYDQILRMIKENESLPIVKELRPPFQSKWVL